ncbi:MAG: hypothetical protein AAFV43_08700 [Planctomycetota bacterium]
MLLLWLAYPLILIAVAAAVWWWVRRGAALDRRSGREAAAARDDFARNLPMLADRFLGVASRSGKPRGLRWVGCQPQAPPTLFARDAKTGELYALHAVEIRFEAVEGGDMEEVEAVGNVRAATAVFVWRGGRWDTDGRVVFNLDPAETLQRFAATLTPCP